MIAVEIRLRRNGQPLREPTAWCLSCADSSFWLHEIARWSLSEEDEHALRLFPLPPGATPELSGVIVALPKNATPRHPPSGSAYGSLGDRLFLPVDASLEPELSIRELEAMLKHDVCIFHPGAGLVGFSHHQILTLSDLLAFPKLHPRPFRRPREGTTWSPKLSSVSLAVPVALDTFFEDEREAIATTSPQAIEPSEDEPSTTGIEGMTNALLEGIYSGLHKAAARIPEGAAAPTWINRVDAWASRGLARITERLDRARHKELHRLLELLEKNVEEGLRHALPFGGKMHRGRADPGSALEDRSLDFSLGLLGGGAPADFWDVPLDLEQKLLARYRELAARERQLGRYRRAAYIYAELIGDFHGAASVLKEGKYYREAAEIYRRHLNEPLQAARCLAAGGLFEDAIALYVEHEQLEEAGDICRKIEAEERARELYGRQCDRHMADGDKLSAARIFETKLEDVTRTLELLETGWPHSDQADGCLERELEILTRESYHERMEARLRHLREEITPSSRVVPLVERLAETARTYPDATLRRVTSDLVHRKIAGRLRASSPEESSRLLEGLYALAPEDRLLVRDGSRFLAERRTHQPVAHHPAGTPPRRIRQLDLPMGAVWDRVVAAGPCFFALGHNDREIYLVRGAWGGGVQKLSWDLRPPRDVASMLPCWMALESIDPPKVILKSPVSDAPFAKKIIPASHRVHDTEGTAGDPGWIPEGTRELVSRGSFWCLLHHEVEQSTLSAYGNEGEHLSDIAVWQHSGFLTEVFMATRNQYVVVGENVQAQGGHLRVVDVGSTRPSKGLSRVEPRYVKLQDAVNAICVSPPFTRARTAVALMQGVFVYWLDTQEKFYVARDMSRPKVCLLDNGVLVVATSDLLRTYQMDAREPSQSSEVSLSECGVEGELVDVVQGERPNELALLTQHGQVTQFSVASR